MATCEGNERYVVKENHDIVEDFLNFKNMVDIIIGFICIFKDNKINIISIGWGVFLFIYLLIYLLFKFP